MSSVTRIQIVTYLTGVCLFSICFLVFLNASVSFVVTDLIRQDHGVGDAVGTLGFVDELVALIACPLWGVASDKVGSRNVCVTGYIIISIALVLFVQAHNVFPQLLLARLLFSLGGAAVSTMVTAILPSMVAYSHETGQIIKSDPPVYGSVHTRPPSIASDSTSTTPRQSKSSTQNNHEASKSFKVTSSTRLAGFVGLFTGLGALIALTLFLPLPAQLRDRSFGVASAVRISYYIVGGVALFVAVACFFGLRGLPMSNEVHRQNYARRSYNQQEKRWQSLYPARVLGKAVRYGFTDASLGLSYIGGFVARASSVAISLFIPLFVNAHFISRGDCGHTNNEIGQIKEHCRQAYILSSQLTGVSQLIALVFAPVFGFAAEKSTRFNLPLILGAILGITGYLSFAYAPTPDFKAKDGSGWIFVSVALIGISQISAIVVSLGILGRCVGGTSGSKGGSLGDPPSAAPGAESPRETQGPRREGEDCTSSSALRSSSANASVAVSESQPLVSLSDRSTASKYDIKGAIAGVYSLAGGAGILLLTKLGGYLFDALSPKTPFVMLAIFNTVLLLTCFACGTLGRLDMGQT